MCTKSFVDWGFAPDPTGELTTLSIPPSWFRGGPPGKRKEGGEGEIVKRREGRSSEMSPCDRPHMTYY